MLSGVAPNGTTHRNAPLSMSIAVMRLYGGFTRGSPRTFNPPPPPPPSPLPPPPPAPRPAGAAPRPPPSPPAAGAGGAPRPAGPPGPGGAGLPAPAPAPDPPVNRAPDRTLPWKYGMSDRPGGAGIRPSVAIEVCDAMKTVWVSGSYEPPGQFVAAACAPIVSVAIGPSILLTDGGVKIGPRRYFSTAFTASACSSGV